MYVECSNYIRPYRKGTNTKCTKKVVNKILSFCGFMKGTVSFANTDNIKDTLTATVFMVFHPNTGP